MINVNMVNITILNKHIDSCLKLGLMSFDFETNFNIACLKNG